MKLSEKVKLNFIVCLVFAVFYWLALRDNNDFKVTLIDAFYLSLSAQTTGTSYIWFRQPNGVRMGQVFKRLNMIHLASVMFLMSL